MLVAGDCVHRGDLCLGGADLQAGLGWTAKGRAELAEAVPAPRYGGHQERHRRGKTDPGLPTAEDGSSGLTGLTGTVPCRRFAPGWADRIEWQDSPGAGGEAAGSAYQ
jgi:hypothetical protein